MMKKIIKHKKTNLNDFLEKNVGIFVEWIIRALTEKNQVWSFIRKSTYNIILWSIFDLIYGSKYVFIESDSFLYLIIIYLPILIQFQCLQISRINISFNLYHLHKLPCVAETSQRRQKSTPPKLFEWNTPTSNQQHELVWL